MPAGPLSVTKGALFGQSGVFGLLYQRVLSPISVLVFTIPPGWPFLSPIALFPSSETPKRCCLRWAAPSPFLPPVSSNDFLQSDMFEPSCFFPQEHTFLLRRKPNPRRCPLPPSQPFSTTSPPLYKWRPSRLYKKVFPAAGISSLSFR